MEKQEERTHMQGFNDGYKLNTFTPHLFEKLRGSLSEGNDYELGMLEGAKEAEKERERQRVKQLESLRNGDKNKAQEKNREGGAER